MKIYLTARIRVKEGFLVETKTALLALVEKSRQETPCLQYDLHQGLEDPLTFLFYEIWESQAGLDAHNAQSYMAEFGSFISDKLTFGPELLKLNRL